MESTSISVSSGIISSMIELLKGFGNLVFGSQFGQLEFNTKIDLCIINS